MAPTLTLECIESRYVARTARTPKMWVARLGNLEVAYMHTRREAEKAALSQAEYVMSDRGHWFRQRYAEQLWPTIGNDTRLASKVSP